MTATTWIVVAPLISKDGQNVQTYFSDDPRDFWSPIKHKTWTIPAVEVRSVQGPEIPLRLGHGQPAAGRIVRLERRALDGAIWCVAELDGDVAPHKGVDYFLSVEADYAARGAIGSDVEIRGAALCARSAMSGLSPAVFTRDGLDHHGRGVFRLGQYQRSLLERADKGKYRRRASDPIVVYNEPTTTVSQPETSHQAARPALGAIEYRSARPVNVSSRHRLIELLAVPYGVEALVDVAGKMIMESISNLAFADVHKQRGRIMATRDHDPRRLVGKVVDVEPFHPDGLHATIRASDTPLGRETVELARDEVLDASIGFMVPQGGDRWTGSSRRRVTRALLRDISLVPEPAYPTRVLAVRGGR